MAGPESIVKQDCKIILDEIGAWHFMPVPTGYGRRGIPDIIACIPRLITPDMIGQKIGQFAGLECKALDSMEPSKWQMKELLAIHRAGGMTSVLGAPTHEDRLRELIGIK